MRKSRGAMIWGPEIKSSVLAMLNLRCLCDIQEEMSSRQSEIQQQTTQQQLPFIDAYYMPNIALDPLYLLDHLILTISL